MSQPFADALTWVPKTRAFAATLTQAHDLARAQGHAAVTLEHLLLALVEDADAVAILNACRISRDWLAEAAAPELSRLPQSDQAVPGADPALLRIVEYAAAAAQQSGRREVNGAIVLAALVGDGASTAARLLQAAGLTFQDTVQALQSGLGQRSQPTAAAPAGSPPPPPAPDTAALVTEDALTTARRRVAAARAMPPPTLTPSLAASETTAENGDVAVQPPLEAGAKMPPPMPRAPHDGAAIREHEDAAEHVTADAAAGDVAAPAVTATGWAPPPLPPTTGRTTWMPPPIPPMAGPRPVTATPPPVDGQDHASSRRPAARAPWVEVAATVAPGSGGVPHEPAEPFEPEAVLEAIPERMRVGMAESVEIRIARVSVLALGTPTLTSPLGHLPDPAARKAISVRLRAKGGGMTVEPMSPETQWVDRHVDSLSDEHLRWRWTVTPKRRGLEHLVVTIGSRSLGNDGLTAEAVLPEQSADVSVRADWRRGVRQAGALLAAAFLGAIVMKLADGVVSAGVTALVRLARG